MSVQGLEEKFLIRPRGAPDMRALAEQDTPRLWDSRLVRNVTEPTLTPYLPAGPNGSAVVVCPGGGFKFLMIDKEGADVAAWLNSLGVTAFVLRYRLAPTPREDADFLAEFEKTGFDLSDLAPYIDGACADGSQAIAAVRERATEYGLDVARVGILGFSAGAVVATSTVLGPDPANRPAFVAALYGGLPDSAAVPSGPPPLFVAYASDDELARDPSRALCRAWRAASGSVECHEYPAGGHGFGLVRQGLPSDAWADSFVGWLNRGGVLSGH